MIVVPYLLSNVEMKNVAGDPVQVPQVQQANAQQIEDVDVIPKLLEYCLVPTYRVSMTRINDSEGITCYRVHIDRVPLQEGQTFNGSSVQYDVYNYDTDKLRKRFYTADIKDDELERVFGLREPIDEKGFTFAPQRFTRASVTLTKSGEKTTLLGFYRLLGNWPTDFVSLAVYLLATGKDNTSITFFNGIVEIQHPEVGCLSISTYKVGGKLTDDADENLLWQTLDSFFLPGTTAPRLRILKSGKTTPGSGI